MTTETTVRLGEIFIKKGWITQTQLMEVLEEQKSNREFIGILLVRKGYLTEDQLLSALAEQFHIPRFTFKNDYIDWNFVMKFSTSLILENKCFPLLQGKRSITFGITNPLNAWGMSKAAEEGGHGVEFVLISESEMQQMLDRYRHEVNLRIRRKLSGG